MNYLKFISITLLIAVYFQNSVYAQEKFEKESRIKQEEVPVKALKFLETLDYNSRVKWYKEEGLKLKSYEAKFSYEKEKYSIEFDSLGNIEDAEIEVNWEEIKTPVYDSVIRHLKKECLKHKIVKVQIQYSGGETELYSILKAKKRTEHLRINYELVVRCKHLNNVDLYEYLFDENGHALTNSKIVLKNSSHLEY